MGMGRKPAPNRGCIATRGHRITLTLTLHQLQVLMRVTEGLTDKEIAKELGISEATVRFHNRSCWPKIGAKNRTQAAIWALKNLSLS